MDREKLTNAILERARESDGEKKLNCAEAFRVAKDCRAAVIEIGRICNEQKIRICNCQLGCFV